MTTTMIYLSQSNCRQLAQTLFGAQCKLTTEKSRNCIYVKDHHGHYRMIGYGIGWHDALESAKHTAEQLIKEGQEIEKQNENKT